MHAFNILGDPVRRRILELLADGEQSAGAVGAVVQDEFGISQPTVSQHLRVLRESGFATMRADGTRRLYAVDPAPLQEVDEWLAPYRKFWNQRLDALGTELVRGRRARSRSDSGQPDGEPAERDSETDPGSNTHPAKTHPTKQRQSKGGRTR